MIIAQDNGQRSYETNMAATLARIEATHGDPSAALDYVTVAIRNYHDSGITVQMHGSLAILAVVLDRLGRYESAATIAGSARSAFNMSFIPELNGAITRLRGVLGDQTYESLARSGKAMTAAAMVTYAFDQIDEARAELNAVSE
ncbi:MAG: hypothetical protein WBZ37_12315 [Mycobacterium sp.]